MKKKKLRLIMFLFLFFAFAVTGFAQSVIQGEVLDEASGEPLVGVSVVIRGTPVGVVTDINGKFSLQIEKNETLEITYIGYLKSTVNVKQGNPYVRIKLAVDLQQLDEIVVVGYGVQTKKSVVASVSVVKGEELIKTGNLNTVSEALQGKLNGVITINSNAKPGDNAAEIYIRGKSSWVNTTPLTIVDGIERDINDVDMNEIESISVLKDASATAVYGVKGANGVIVLTTKRGGISKPKVTFSANFGFKQFTTKMEFADYVTSMKMYNEAAANDQDWTKQIPQSTIDAWEYAYKTGNYGPYNDVFPQVDWWKAMIRPIGLSQNYNINISGGNDIVKYFASVGYQNDGDNYNIGKQADFDPRYYYKRYNWRSNLDFKLTKTTTFSVNIAGKFGTRNEPTGSNETNELFTPIIQSPTNKFPIKYSDGNWGEGEVLGYNVMANTATRGQRTNKSFEGWYDAYLVQNLDFIVKGLSAKIMVGYNSASSLVSTITNGQVYGSNAFESQSSIVRYYRPYDYSNPIVNPDGTITYPPLPGKRYPEGDIGNYPVNVSYDNFNSYNRKLTYEGSLNYKASFGDHNISALFLFSRKITDVNSGTGAFAFPSYYEDYVGRVTYNWKERYLVEYNGADDGSEKFAPGKRFNYFSSISVGWRVSEEPFVKKLTGDKLSNLKLTYSYGTVGSDIGSDRFVYFDSYTSSGSANYGYLQNNPFGPLYSELSVGNPDATWETAIKQKLGIELGLWNRFIMSVDLFKEDRTGLLMKRRTLPAWVAVKNMPQVNIGGTKNHGIDAEFSWHDKIGKNFSYNAGLMFSTSENRVVYMDDPPDLPKYLRSEGTPIGLQSRYLVVGNYGSIDDVFNYPISTITSDKITPGDLVFIDINGDGKLDTNDNAPVKELNYPLTTYSITLGCKYKNIGLSMLFYSPQGVYKLQQSNLLWDFPMSNIKAQPNTLDRWTPETANATGVMKPAVHLWDATVANGNGSSHNKPGGDQSTYSYMDYSYFRLKNMEINYSIPKKLLQKFSIDNCQFFANGNDLFTISKVDKRTDPETGGSGSYPIVKTYTVGLRLGF